MDQHEWVSKYWEKVNTSLTNTMMERWVDGQKDNVKNIISQHTVMLTRFVCVCVGGGGGTEQYVITLPNHGSV